MANKTVAFDKTDAGTKMFAIFVAQLVKEGVTYDLDSTPTKYYVTITGGF